ncbi:4-(cytidine 5'-diphospho)-2-C-methyl-D-erythritol kinase [Motilimonas sp. E26]|uniref:4-(cytidine 5'-diphospho)-2-C-methyl-D-erythritol kinase n=1 Tax=Motilimonas sp. E26 TaxID=2865674 RepID=UPI001E2A2112|nr:4-(cytidine 5'-diphospho)-2-C-methyl-D-erythritol kinase [Motilimonas sp. E26]MCE0556050.1 4-(cytidine 5'-diphospho)-2-C-methyl-D-erythritol kinase [Motilimonas sp. E26]
MSGPLSNLDPIRWPAPAKLNLFLYVNGQRPDGYHELQTLFQFVDKADYLTIQVNQSGHISIAPESEIKLEDNLIFKAARALQQFSGTKLGAHIDVEKNLPMGGGLGGGSSDAATTLVALNQQWQLDYSNDVLADIGVKLGADVPIFIHGRAAIAEGVGEKLTSVEVAEPWYVIAVPPVHVATVSVFTHKELIRNTPKCSIEQLLQASWHNDCEPLVKKQYPEVAKAIDALIEYAPSRLTGTGACVFATCNNQQHAQSILDSCPAWLNGFVTQGSNESALYKQLKLRIKK